jgi:hypothetical protein
MVGFCVTFVDENGQPAITSKGWLFNTERKVLTPATRTKFGRWQRFTEVMPEWEAKIRAALEAKPEVLKILGPVPVEKVEGTDGLRKVEGEVEV